MLKRKFDHWLCNGIYVRTNSTFSSIKERFEQLKAGFAFIGDSFDEMGVRDRDEQLHQWKDIRPSTKVERAVFYDGNPNRKPTKVVN